VKKIGKEKVLMGRKLAALLIPAVLGMFWVSFGFWARETPTEAVGVQLVCLTNIPSLGPRALFNITNRTDALIGIPGHGHVSPGESVTLPFLIPAGTSPWRVSLAWQCLDPSWFDLSMNRLWRRVQDAFGTSRSVDARFPSMRISYSPEIQR
jgi:hypothetical protein